MVEWCVIIYDKQGADRSTCRAEHFAGIPPLVAQGKLVTAGAIYDSVVDGEPTKPIGSHLVFSTDDKEEILSLINGDVFAKNGIWDLDSIIIHPFNCAVRTSPKEIKL